MRWSFLPLLFMLACPCLAQAGTPLLMMQQQQVWHLQQVERGKLARQQARRQRALRQSGKEIPPPQAAVPGRKSFENPRLAPPP